MQISGIKRPCGARSGIIALTIGLNCNVAIAQVSSDANEVSNREEIVVTARKREESLQEVPLSITAFTAEKLQNAGVTNNYEVATLAVNFNTLPQVGRRLDRPTIRGQASPAVTGEANASYFIDGVFVSGSISTVTLGPIERVEILRGPQSAQFGRATFSGAINYVTRKPSNEFTGEVQAKAGNRETRQFSAWASGPLIEDKLAVFAAAGWDRYGGEWNNSLRANQANKPALFIDPPQNGDNSDLGGTDTKDFVAKLLWTPNDTSEFQLKVGYTRGDDDHYVQLIQEPGELNCYLPTPDNSDEPWFTTSLGQFCGTLDIDSVSYVANNPFNPNSPDFDPTTYFPNSKNLIDNLPGQGGSRQARYNLPDFYQGITSQDASFFFPGTTAEDFSAAPIEPGTRREQTRFMFQYDQQLRDDWSMGARIAANQDDLEQAFDLDRTEQRILNGVFNMVGVNDRDDKSFELWVAGPADGMVSGRAGIYYYDRDREDIQRQFVGTAQGQFTTPTFRSTENKAVFGSIDIRPDDRFSFSAEARWANDTKTVGSLLKITTLGPIAANPNICDFPPVLGAQVPVGEQVTSRSFTPRFTVRYEPDDNKMFYALIAKGTKPAEFNDAYFRTATADACGSLVAIEDGATVIKEEEAWTREAGFKLTWLNGRLTTNLSIFKIEWENQGVFQRAIVGGTPTQITKNAGESEVFGGEFESSFVLADNLTGTFGYGLADGKYLSYDDPGFADTTGVGLGPDGELVNGSNNVGGNSLPSSPKHNFVATLDYVRNISVSTDMFARTEFIYEGRRFTAADNFIKIPSRKLWNARIGLDREDWRLTAFVRNILDERTPASVFAFQVLSGIDWDNGYNCAGATDANGNCALADRIPVPATNSPEFAGRDVLLFSATPTPGRAYGLELLYRFGN